jgi:hypothetical protein
MTAKLYGLKFSTEILQRGFWLYVWVIRASEGRILHYVGRTGDSASPNAQSPFSRISGHLGSNKHANALTRNLEKLGIKLGECENLEFVTYGPLDEQANTMEEHIPKRDKIHALERDLCKGMSEAGYTVINKVTCRLPTNEGDWLKVRVEFSKRFPRLLRQT